MSFWVSPEVKLRQPAACRRNRSEQLKEDRRSKLVPPIGGPRQERLQLLESLGAGARDPRINSIKVRAVGEERRPFGQGRWGKGLGRNSTIPSLRSSFSNILGSR